MDDSTGAGAAAEIVSLSKDGESAAVAGTKAKDREMLVEGGSLFYTEPAHDGKAGPIDHGEILVFPGEADLPGGFKIGGTDRFDHGEAAPQSFPELLRRPAVEAISNQSPRLHQHVIGSNQRFSGAKNSSGAGIVDISGIRCSVPGGSIDE